MVFFFDKFYQIFDDKYFLVCFFLFALQKEERKTTSNLRAYRCSEYDNKRKHLCQREEGKVKGKREILDTPLRFFTTLK